MSNETKEWLIKELRNVIVLIIFAVVSIYFETWWIMLCAIIFYQFPRKEK